MSVWDRRKEILYGNRLVDEVSQNNLTPELEVYGTECMLWRLSVIYLFIYLFIYMQYMQSYSDITHICRAYSLIEGCMQLQWYYT